MTAVVITQPMYFPWVGMLEQIRLSDILVHYTDVQFTRGGFSNRVQVKTRHGVRWMTVPLRKHSLGQTFNQVYLDESKDWRNQHRDILCQAHKNSPYRDEMLALVDRVFSKPATTLAELACSSMMELATYFHLCDKKVTVDSQNLPVPGVSSARVRDIVSFLKGDVYITGHGARNYLDHSLFDASHIEVRYMQYRLTPYPQQYDLFTPYVTALDLIANCGPSGCQYIRSETVSYGEFVRDTHERS